MQHRIHPRKAVGVATSSLTRNRRVIRPRLSPSRPSPIRIGTFRGRTASITFPPARKARLQPTRLARVQAIAQLISAPAAQPYALLLITARGDVIDLGDNRRFPFTITAREIANDLLQDLHDHGIFVCAGPRPTPEELATAAARRDAYYQRLITEGDTMWARGHSFREISDLHRRAAISLGVEREWAYVPMRMHECPACGEKVKPAVAVCKHCGAILDAEKAAKHGLGAGAGGNAVVNAKTRQS